VLWYEIKLLENRFAENALEVQVHNNKPAIARSLLGHVRGSLKQVKGGGPPPLLSTGETHLKCWVLFWAPQYMDILEQTQ